jgi:hypothetical protein
MSRSYISSPPSASMAYNGTAKGLHTGSTLLVVTYCFVPPLRKAKFRDVPSRVTVKIGCAVKKKGCGTLP